DLGPELVDDLAQPTVDVLRAVDQGLPRRLDELAQLLDRRLAEDRRGVPDEVDPELAGGLLGLGWRAEAHQPLLEPLRLEAARERLFDDEHAPVAPSPKDLADADAVVGRAERALGEEHDRGHLPGDGIGAATIAGCPS